MYVWYLLVVVLTVCEYGGQNHEADSHDDEEHHLQLLQTQVRQR